MLQPPAGDDLGRVWEVVKGVLLFLVTGGVGFIAKMVFNIRDDVRDTKKDVSDPKDGLKVKVAEQSDRLDAIEERNLVIDAVAKIEGEQHQGDERRHGLRTLRAIMREEFIAMTDEHRRAT